MRVFASIRRVSSVLPMFAASLLCFAQEGAQTSKLPSRWLLKYDERIPFIEQARDVRGDPKYLPLLRENLKQMSYIWNAPQPLWQVAGDFLGVGGGRVKVVGERYAVITGCVPHRCDELEGFLWVDTDAKKPELFFAALEAISGEGTHGPPTPFHLWVFSNRPNSWDFSQNGSLPDAFTYPLQDWFDEIGGRQVVSVMFVSPNGNMTPLLPSAIHLAGVSGRPHESNDIQPQEQQ